MTIWSFPLMIDLMKNQWGMITRNYAMGSCTKDNYCQTIEQARALLGEKKKLLSFLC